MIFGLHTIDIIIIVVFVALMVYIGMRISRSVRGSEDFFIANRTMGKGLQFFLLFGQATDADTAVVVAREVYRQGISGLWLSFRLLFMTPFHWFLAKWHRRLRIVTISDVFMERYRSAFISMFFAGFQVFMTLFGIGMGYIVAYKTIKALTLKPAIEYTVEERASVAQYDRMRALEIQRTHRQLPAAEAAELAVLHEKNKRGELQSYFSYFKPVPFYIIYGLIICSYTLLGGLMAATINDIFQSILIFVFSFILIPSGFMRIGGFSGLHERVPDTLFNLFSTNGGEYTWYWVLTLALMNLVGTLYYSANATVSSAARTEFDAQFGMISGSFVKRIVMIAWGLCGLLAIALYGTSISDPDTIWGVMTRDLLGPGFVGIMLVGFLAANMSTKSSFSISYAALFTNNLYKPLFPGRSDTHYLFVSRLAVCGILFGGIFIAMRFESILELIKISFAVTGIFGAPMWLGLFWRRATRKAVIVEIVVSCAILLAVPMLGTTCKPLRTCEALQAQTAKRINRIETFATVADVEAGAAVKPGEHIVKQEVIEPVGIYFQNVVRTNPDDPASACEGRGEFYPQIVVLHCLGMDFSKDTKADIETARFLFNLFFPFLLLIGLSLLMKPEEKKEDLDAFFAKKNTPVDRDPEKDAQAVAAGARDYARFRGQLLFPGTQIEILKPAWKDIVGFCACWALVGLIYLILWGATKI